MGNVPISCCRSKSPRSQRNLTNHGHCEQNPNCTGDQYSSQAASLHNATKLRQARGLNASNHTSYILQHISEREPDDSETDPSSNPLNRPIFASRSSSCKNKISSNSDSYSSNNSTTRRQIAPLTSSQDHGYNSNTSTNLTHHSFHPNDSFSSSIERSDERPALSGSGNFCGNRYLLSNSPSSLDKEGDSLSSFELETNRHESRPFVLHLVKSSSCSTIFLDGSTISQPNLRLTIKCVSLAIYYHIKNRTSDDSVEIFDETIHPLRMPSSMNGAQDKIPTPDDKEANQMKPSSFEADPDEKTIYLFVRTLFKAAQLTSEYAITTLVYLERLMTYAEMDLTPKTWRRMFLGAILLSSKVWEDQAVWNVDYAQILEEISVEDINELERQFLELIQFNMNVPSSVYAKYYFHLRTLALKNGLGERYTLLTVSDAKTLEAMSRVYLMDINSSPIHRKSSITLKRHTSLERLRINGQARAVLM